MVDPISGLGTAVGIASLGIQVCQSLYRYYSHFKDFDKDIDSILDRLVELESRLNLLDSLRPLVEVSGSPVSLGLQRALNACDVGASDLQLMMQKCGSTKPPASTQEKIRLLKSRILWPLRKDNVSSMGTTLDRLIHDVQFAVQILQIQIAQKSSQVQEAGLITTTTRIDQAQATILQAIQSGMANLPGNHLTSDEAMKLGIMSQQMSLQLASVQHQLGQLIIAKERQKIEKLPELAPTSEVAKHLPAPRRMVPCTCRARKSSPWFGKFGRLIRVEAFRREEHYVDCDSHHTGDLTYTIQAQYQHYTQALNFCVQASFSLARISGRYTVQPTLQMWTMKQPDSPAFSPFFNINKKFGCGCNMYVRYDFCCTCGTPEDGPLVIQSVTEELRNSYKNGSASPYDMMIDPRHTVVERAYGLCFDMVRLGYINPQTARDFLHFVTRVSRPTPGEDQIHNLIWIASSASNYPMDARTSENMAEIWKHLISYLGSWKLAYKFPHPDHRSMITRMLRSSELLAVFDCGCPLELAIWQRSKQDLIRELHIHHRKKCDDPQITGMYMMCWNEADLISLAMQWREGLEILLSDPITQELTLDFDIYDSGNFELRMGVGSTVEVLDFDGLRMLHQAGFLVYPFAWSHACCFMRISSHDPQVHGGMLKLLQQLANAMYECTNIGYTTSTQRSLHPRAVTSYNNLYNTPYMTRQSAQYLWEAGFKLIDEVSVNDQNVRSSFGTPLWTQALEPRLYNSADWKLLSWYVDRGARLNWEHPEHLTTPAHLIGHLFARNHCYRPSYSYSSHSRGARFIVKVLSYIHLDSCNCRCSIAGCLPIGCAVKRFFSLGFVETVHEPQCRLILKLISKVVDTEQALRLSTGLSVIRVLTFDELGLTHTCCKSLSHDQEWSEDAIRDVQHIESQDINLLEAMMVDFEQAWSEHSASFYKFLKNIWIPRIKEHHARIASEDKAEAISQIKSTGVVLWEPFGPRPPQSYTNSDRGSSDDVEDNPEVGTAVVSENVSESQADDDLKDDLDDPSEEVLEDNLDNDTDGSDSTEEQDPTDTDLEDDWKMTTAYDFDDGFF
ncbi:hypothetical protein M3J07_007093 [Ascochyta lentis]